MYPFWSVSSDEHLKIKYIIKQNKTKFELKFLIY